MNQNEKSLKLVNQKGKSCGAVIFRIGNILVRMLSGKVYGSTMADFPKDIYTEPEPDVDTLANLGPLSGMAGIWTGTRGLDVNPKPDGPEKQAFIEHMELQPIDAQTNGRNCSTDCATTRGSSSLMMSRHFTIRSALGYGNRRRAP